MKRSLGLRTQSTSWRSLGLIGLAIAAACAPARPAVTPAPMGPAPGVPDAAPMVRVGLLVDTTLVTLSANTTLEIFDGSTGAALFEISAGDVSVVRGGPSGEVVVSYGGRDEVAANLIFARPRPGGLISIGSRPYRGAALVRSAGPGRVTAVNQIDLENYLLGVVPYEIGRVGPDLHQASKAQAVAARTYAIRYLGRRDSLGFDVFASVDDQVYGGAEGEHDPISIAVRETAGEILTFAGQPITAFYHSTCSGRTAAIEEVWLDPPQPYLKSVIDVNPATGEAFDITSSRYRWTQRWTAEELTAIFNRTLADSLPPGVSDVGEIRDFETLELTPSGRIAKMRITTSKATFEVGRDRIRWIFLTQSGSILNSSKFDIRTEPDATGRISEVIAEGMGWGHGIGMCQVGAMGRARAGQEYQSILRTYYVGSALTRLY